MKLRSSSSLILHKISVDPSVFTMTYIGTKSKQHNPVSSFSENSVCILSGMCTKEKNRLEDQSYLIRHMHK